MSEVPITIKFDIPDSEIVRSGVDAAIYIRGVAKRHAVEKSSRVGMVEYRFDDDAKMHRAIVYLKAKG